MSILLQDFIVSPSPLLGFIGFELGWDWVLGFRDLWVWALDFFYGAWTGDNSTFFDNPLSSSCVLLPTWYELGHLPDTITQAP